MLVDLVLAVDEQYWRSWRELPAVPDTGSVLQVLADPELNATVAGSTYPGVGAADRSAAAAVLVRATASPPDGAGAALRRAGWHQLL